MSRFVRGTDYFSILERGINGVYHHVSHEHLPMCLAEFDFRYNARSGTWHQRSATRWQIAQGYHRQAINISTADEAQDH